MNSTQTIMTAAEAKVKISEEFMNKFYEWLEDEKNLSDHDFGWKYGWCKPKKLHKDNLKAVTAFQTYIFCSYRNNEQWEKAGYERRVIWELCHESFLSEKMEKWHTYYYISQRTAKQIYKEYKGKAKA